MALQIVTGTPPLPIRAVVYGPEGIGKTTFASRWPKPIFIDLERGTGRLAVDRVYAGTVSEVESILAELATQDAYRTIVFDTADKLDQLMIRAVCDAGGKSGIEEFGFGKGYVFVAEKWGSFLDRLNRFSDRYKMHVVFLAHAALRKFEQPDETGSYDRWELKCAKQTCPLLKEWADTLLFANYKTIVVEQDNGKKKASGGKRVIYTSHHPCWDAKNRFEFPAELAMPAEKLPDELAAVIAKNTVAAPKPVPTPNQAAAKQPAEAPKVETKAEATEPPPAVVDPEAQEYLSKLFDLMALGGISKEELQKEVARCGVAPVVTPVEKYNLATLKRLVANFEAIKTNIKGA